MAKNPTQLEELQNINIESEMMAFNGTKKAFRAPLSSLTNVLNAGNLKMPGSDKTIAEYYRYMSGKQMLINADFEKPINQRSQTTYPAAGNAYIIDCWNAQNAAVRLDSDGIVFEGGNGFNQSVEFPEKFLGKTITLSALVTENSAEGNFGPNTAVNAFNHSQWPAGYMSFDKNTAPGLWTITGKLPDSMPSGHTHLNFGMWFLKNERLKIRAMKLEFGDHQTLAHREGNKWVLNDPPPNYALELAKCQRYLMPFGGAQTYLADAGAGGKSPRVYLSKNFYKFRAKPTLTKASFSNTTFMGSDHYFYNKAATLVDITEFDDSYLVTFSMPDIEGFTSNAIGGFSMSDQNVFLSAEL